MSSVTDTMKDTATAPALTRIFNTPEGAAVIQFHSLPPALVVGHQVTVNWTDNGQTKRYTGLVQRVETQINGFGAGPVLIGRVTETVYLDAARCIVMTDGEPRS